MREHKGKDHGAQKGSGAQNADITQILGDVVDKSLKEKLETCNHFLEDSEIENGRHRVYNFAMDSLHPGDLLEKLDVVYDSLKCAAKLNVAFCFELRNIEDGSCRY